MSFGNVLIKQVVEDLGKEFPSRQDICDALTNPRVPHLARGTGDHRAGIDVTGAGERWSRRVMTLLPQTSPLCPARFARK